MIHLSHFFSITFSLFILMNGIGNVPIFMAHLKEVPARKHKKIILREMTIALFVMLLFMFIGNYILSILSISRSSVFITGGIILFMLALQMIFPAMQPDKTKKEPREKEPFIVPLAIPFVAGPGLLASIALFSSEQTSFFFLALAILSAWSASTIILLFSSVLAKILGKRGVLASERLMGLLLTLIAIQMFLNGLKEFIES